MLSKENSLRLSLLGFPLIAGVVFGHAGSASVVMSGSNFGLLHSSAVEDFIVTLVSRTFTCVTIPLFFLMSGYLFFSGTEWSKTAYFSKLQSRARTLLFPFLFWNIAVMALIAAAQAFPATRGYFSGKSAFIADYGLWDYPQAILGINRYPIAFQFWFIRDLLVLVVLSPAIAFLIRRTPLPFFAAATVLWFLRLDPPWLPPSEGLLFFSLGGWMGMHGKNLFGLDRFGLSAWLLYFPVAVADALTYQQPINLLPHRVGIVLGVIGWLALTKYLSRPEPLKRALLWLGGVSFWVYATHEPLLTIVKRLIYKAIRPESPLLDLALYFTLPLGVILLSIGLQQAASRLAPGLTAAVTGGRAEPRAQKPGAAEAKQPPLAGHPRLSPTAAHPSPHS